MIHCGLKTRKDRSVQETEQYFYFTFFFLPLIRRIVQLSRSQQPAHDASSSSSCFTADRSLKCITTTYLSNGPVIPGFRGIFFRFLQPKMTDFAVAFLNLR